MKLLVVDDDPLLLELMQDMLEGQGYALLLAANGAQAWEILQTGDVDIVLTDLVMPEREGIEIIQEIRRNFPGIRIIAMSGRSQNDLDIDWLQLVRVLGADATLTKPFSLEQMELLLAAMSSRH